MYQDGVQLIGNGVQSRTFSFIACLALYTATKTKVYARKRMSPSPLTVTLSVVLGTVLKALPIHKDSGEGRRHLRHPKVQLLKFRRAWATITLEQQSRSSTVCNLASCFAQYSSGRESAFGSLHSPDFAARTNPVVRRKFKLQRP